MTILEQRRALRDALTAAPASVGIHDAAVEADGILCYVLGVEPGKLLCNGAQELPDALYRQAQALLARRLCGEPLQYLIGSADFFGLSFLVSPGVLIPRADSEVLVEEALAEPFLGPVYDVCCGSGCLLLSILSYRKEMQGTGIDFSNVALSVARENGARLGLADRVCWMQWDVLADELPIEPIDLILCNPPYIPSAMCAMLDQTVLQEPMLALDGGEDGLRFYRILLPRLLKLLRPGGRLLFEIGSEQADALKALAKGLPLTMYVRRDYGGRDRAVIFTKKQT